jgi:hypothetical protein
VVREEVGAGGEMIQALYTHINNKKIKIKKKKYMYCYKENHLCYQQEELAHHFPLRIALVSERNISCKS